MQEVSAFCPASLSFIFKYCPNKNLAKMGSIGIGCTIDKGVIVRVQRSSRFQILFNGTPIKFPTIALVVKTLCPQPVKVRIETKLPLGYGFGMSGACALASAFALNQLFSLSKNDLELTTVAHIAEVANKTGLGSVATQATGGFLIRTCPGIPVVTKTLPLVGQSLYTTLVDKLETHTIIGDMEKMTKVNQAADCALNKIKRKKSLTIAEILDISFEFAKNSLLLTNSKVGSIIDKIRANGGRATMAMLGQVVISDIDPKLSGRFRVEKLTVIKDRVNLL